MSIALGQMSSLCASRNSCPLEPRALPERGLHTWTAPVDSVPFAFWLCLASESPSRRPEGKGCSLLVHSLWGFPRLPAFLPPPPQVTGPLKAAANTTLFFLFWLSVSVPSFLQARDGDSSTVQTSVPSVSLVVSLHSSQTFVIRFICK